ncbi:unnamed protein product [Arctogadus glacialis]
MDEGTDVVCPDLSPARYWQVSASSYFPPRPVCCLLLSGAQVPERGRRSTKINVTIATELLAYYKSTQRSAIIVQVDEEGR